ncbi:Nin one binding Zn-ribbon like protein [Oesophagostomum dentatum]|uniref:Nin one binding Zn-ribbon like protein n=1 Tax=Oesophagostomum dentatum TaxID=61180 RepID=A0A0B1SMA6_OESDE|nr:Nin one binding Zn-ribbon like protein [Oesophagostomum dentatum]
MSEDAIDMDEIAEHYYSPPEVVTELKSRRSKITFDILPFEVVIREPTTEAIRKVVEASKKTGDFVSLSLVDIKVIALTYDLHSEFSTRNKESSEKQPESETSIESILDEIRLNSEQNRLDDESSPTTAESHVDDTTPLQNNLPEGFCEASDSDDDEGWITEDNLGKALRKMGALEVEEGLTVGCLTTDFALQNVLLSMHLGLVSLNGYRIKKLKSFVLRCRACFKTTPIMTKEFCPACGNKMLHKCAVSVNEDGEQVLHINWQRLANKRGLKHSLAAPKGGKHAVNEKLFEDQRMPQNRMAKVRADPFADSPFAVHDVTSRSAMLGIRTMNNRQKQRRNPNEAQTGHRRKYSRTVMLFQCVVFSEMSSIYYCHQCRNQVPLRNTDMICGICGGEFLEQMTVPPPRPQPRIVHHPAGRNFLSSLMGMFNAVSHPPHPPSTSSQTEEGAASGATNNARPQGPQSMTFSLDQAMQLHPILSQVLATLGNPNMQVRIHIGDDAE